MKKDDIFNASWSEIINAYTNEIHPDIKWYKDLLLLAGIDLVRLSGMAQNRSFRISKMESRAIELSFRKGDHTAVTVITPDGKMRTMMKDYLDY